MSKDVVCGFAVRKTYEGQSNWDQTYKEIEIKKKLVPLGPVDENGDVPYTEEIVEIVKEIPIKDVIDSQNDSAGLEAFMKPYRLSGTMPPDVEVGKDIQDFTIFDDGKDLRTSGMVAELFESLPDGLKEKYGNPEKLLREISDAALEDYAKKFVEASMKKPDEKNEEEE